VIVSFAQFKFKMMLQTLTKIAGVAHIHNDQGKMGKDF
jgi:hypothetical protein